MHTPTHDRSHEPVAAANAFLGALVADAVAMPVHWYYNQQALARDSPEFAAATLAGYVAPKNPHADSILWRSHYTPANEKGDILREQARYWGQRGIHYHQFLAAGENTLNYQLATELAAEAVHVMETHRITSLPVVDADGVLVGALNVHDLLRSGVI